MEDGYSCRLQLEQFFLNVAYDISNLSMAENIIYIIRDISIQNILIIIRDSRYSPQKIISRNIPQFSQFYDYENVVRIVMDSGEKDISFKMLGYYLEGEKSPLALAKYGENHYKLASQLGLVTNGKHRDVTSIGKAYRLVPDDSERHMIGCKLCLRIPVIWKLIFFACIGPVDATNFLQRYLAPSTALRRKSNIRKILRYIQSYDTEERQYIYNNIRW